MIAVETADNTEGIVGSCIGVAGLFGLRLVLGRSVGEMGATGGNLVRLAPVASPAQSLEVFRCRHTASRERDDMVNFEQKVRLRRDGDRAILAGVIVSRLD